MILCHTTALYRFRNQFEVEDMCWPSGQFAFSKKGRPGNKGMTAIGRIIIQLLISTKNGPMTLHYGPQVLDCSRDKTIQERLKSVKIRNSFHRTRIFKGVKCLNYCQMRDEVHARARHARFLYNELNLSNNFSEKWKKV